MVDRESGSREEENKSNGGAKGGFKNYISIPVENPFSKGPVWYSPATGSTMDDAEEYLAGRSRGRCSDGKWGNSPQQLRETGVSGTVFCAGYQRAGKGRMPGRSWHAEAGKNLLFTLILNKADFFRPLQLFPLLSGLALCRILETDFMLSPRIKWPNDVLVKGRKIAGILCQMRGEWLFLGMGVNCNQERFPEKIYSSTTSINIETGAQVEPDGLLGGLLTSCAAAYEDSCWRSEIESRLAYRNREVEIRIRGGGSEKFIARIIGIDAEGRLFYRRPDRNGEERLAAGEIRPVSGPHAAGI